MFFHQNVGTEKLVAIGVMQQCLERPNKANSDWTHATLAATMTLMTGEGRSARKRRGQGRETVPEEPISVDSRRDTRRFAVS
ncbi:unnamed protein product [Heligmosomoides polygyrus]|uniref:Uncharacterized protein n=1 Tax=Heligmosomoides polygyrus TaxID=6339 RepID=A0A183G1W8_HELPZ|nr:unnamed protein product [Heligmosomoides polygyrus]